MQLVKTWTLPKWRAEPSFKGYRSIGIKGCRSWLRGVYTDEDSVLVGGEQGRRCDMYTTYALGADATAPSSRHVEPVIPATGQHVSGLAYAALGRTDVRVLPLYGDT